MTLHLRPRQLVRGALAVGVGIAVPSWGPLASGAPRAPLVVFTQYVDNGMGSDDNLTVYVARLGSRAAHRLSESCVDCADNGRWSPDGTTIVYQENEGIYAIHPDGSDKRLVCASTPRNQWCEDFPTWSPDGRQIAFSLARGGIGVAPARGGPVKLLPRTRKYGVTGLDWSPDGRQFAFESRYDAVDGILANGTGGRRIASHAVSPRWSPDGLRLLFQSENDAEIFVSGPGGRIQKMLKINADSPNWQDDTHLFYATRDSFYSYDLSANRASRIAPLPDVCRGRGVFCASFDVQPIH